MSATERETLSPAARVLEIAIVAMMLFLFAFLLTHQLRGTGFFTDRFGPFEMFCLYGPIGLALVAPLARALTGRRSAAWPVEAATSLFLAAGSLWLAIRFPFDFPHLADVLPAGIRFLLAWVTTGIGRALLILQVVIGPLSALTVARRNIKGVA